MHQKLTSKPIESLEARTLLTLTRIMPLGDSITEGYNQISYRYDLYNLLAQAGYSVDFVGGQTGTYNGVPAYNNFDENHEGHSGYRADQIRDNVVAWATANKPDVVLLHAGTNDINASQDNPGTASEITSIIDNLRGVVPNVKIVLAEIIPGVTNPSYYPDLNSRIATLASTKTTVNSPITLVDQYSGFNVSTDEYDGIHPNPSGEMKMAQKWFTALQGILPAPVAPPPGTYLDGLTPTSASNGSGNFEQDRSNGGTGPIDGRTLTLNGAIYMRGLGVAASSTLVYNVAGGGYTQFNADIGVDDETASGGGIKFQVYADNALKYDSGTMTATSATKSISVDITGAGALKLVVSDAGGGSAGVDHGDWGSARVYAAAVVAAPAAPTALTATPGSTSIALHWNDNSNNETGFRIDRKTGSGGSYAQLADLSANSTGYADATAAAGTTYYYRVYAYNAGGSSAYSNEASGTIPFVATSGYLSDLPFVVISNGWGLPEKDKSNGESGSNDGRTITLAGKTYAKGLGVHAPSEIDLNLGGGYSTFASDIGVDDEVGGSGSVDFQVWLDGAKAYDSGTMTGASATKNVSLSLTGKSTIQLIVTDTGDGNAFDHADWAGAYLSTAAVTLPAAPSNAVATLIGNASINIGWQDNASNEAGFTIQRKTGSGAWADLISVGVNVISYTDTAVSPATTYSYRVYATNSAGSSSTSNEPSVTTPSITSAYLSDLPYVVNDNGWGMPERDKSNGESSDHDGNPLTLNGKTYVKGIGAHAHSDITYNLAGSYTAFTADIGVDDEVGSNGSVVFQIYLDGMKVFDSGKMTGSTATQSVNVNTTGKQSLQLIVTDSGDGNAYDHADWANALLTAGAVTLPTAPSNAAAAYNSVSGAVTVTWADNSNNENGFVIERKPGLAGAWGQIFTTAANATSYIDAAVAGNQTYYYRVSAINSAGASGVSNEALVSVPLPAAPTAPTNLAGSYQSGAGGGVRLSWDDNSSNEAGFRIERQTGSAAYAALVNTAANATSYIDSTAVAGATYTYRVCAYNAGGDSSASNEQTITVPSTPTSVYLSDLTPISSTNGWGPVEKDTSNGEAGAGDGRTITIRGVSYAKGLGVHGYSKIVYNLGGAYSSFASDVGIDDETGGNGSVVFEVYVDGALKYSSGTVRGLSAVQHAMVSVAGAQQLWLVVQNANDGPDFDHADWANARMNG